MGRIDVHLFWTVLGGAKQSVYSLFYGSSQSARGLDRRSVWQSKKLPLSSAPLLNAAPCRSTRSRQHAVKHEPLEAG